MSGITYLASPYTHPLQEVRQRRFKQAIAAAAELMKCGKVVFCPIAHSHEIGIALNEETSFDFWMKQDLPILRVSSELVILKLDGWEDSRGVITERALARELLLPIHYMEPA